MFMIHTLVNQTLFFQEVQEYSMQQRRTESEKLSLKPDPAPKTKTPNPLRIQFTSNFLTPDPAPARAYLCHDANFVNQKIKHTHS